MRRHRLRFAAFLLLFLAAGPVALAGGPYTDDLSRCLVTSTTSGDKAVLVQWIFSTMALHPDVKWLASASDAQRAELSKKTAALFERLLTDSCKSQTRDAVKYEGSPAIEASFSVLGQVAARELLGNPSVAAGLADMEKHLDAEKLRKALNLKE